jgi:hypothetical protein
MMLYERLFYSPSSVFRILLEVQRKCMRCDQWTFSDKYRLPKFAWEVLLSGSGQNDLQEQLDSSFFEGAGKRADDLHFCGHCGSSQRYEEYNSLVALPDSIVRVCRLSCVM